MRSALVTNSSISLPTCRVMPRMMAPAEMSASTRRWSAVVHELDRIEEALDQSDMILGEGRIKAIDRLGQHRVAEAVDHMRELGDDRRIDGDIVTVGNEEYVDVGLDFAGELLEHEMLVLHFGAELRGLEQAFAIPFDCPARRLECSHAVEQAIRSKKGACLPTAQHNRLGVLDEPIVLGMEDVMDGGQADVLVGTTVTGDIVRVEQFVVVGAMVRSRDC